jgi:hypothetical protein
MELPNMFKTGTIITLIEKRGDESIFEVIHPVSNSGLMMVKRINDSNHTALTAYAINFKVATEKEKMESKLKNIFTQIK